MEKTDYIFCESYARYGHLKGIKAEKCHFQCDKCKELETTPKTQMK